MKITTRIFGILMVIATIIFMDACKGEKGDIGPSGANGTTGATGATGAKGDKGDTGGGSGTTSNGVILIKFGSVTHTGSEVAFDLKTLTEAEINGSAFFFYVNTSQTSTLWAPIPGVVPNSGNSYRFSINTQPSGFNNPRLYLLRVSGSGSEIFPSSRLVLVPAADVRSGRKAAVDYTDYEAVKAYYGLKD